MNARTFPGDWREPREPYTGPHTGQELSWLEVLEETEARQGRVAFAAVLPAYDGPVTGELERLPGEPGPAGGALQRHRARFTVFSAVGAAVLVAGIAVQALLIAAHAGRYGSYAGQAVFSIEASFALNWLVTWRDRKSPFRAACWRFNVQKLALTVPNFALYALLVRLGAGWLAANLAVTAVFTAANYVLGDQWAFTAARAVRRGRGGQALPPVTPLPPWWQPPVSAVIPCKGNEATILATVQSLLAQDYPGLTEVILVGDVGDSTWAALAGVRDPRLRLLEQEKTPGRRDPNVKRDKGARAASGEVLALADSDIVMDPGWLSRAVGLLREQGGGLVGGGMRAIKPHLFWPRFVDNNVLAAKTSRIPRAYQVTAANFGHRHRKPPVTANAVLTRAAYDACPLDTAWAYGYEDYEWMHRLTAGGCTVTMDPGLTGDHHHREKFAHLIREYRRSAHGCAQFVRRHPGSALAGKRRAQAIGLPLAAATALAAGIAAAAAGHALAVLALAIGTIAVLSGREALRSRSVIGAVYPAAALALGGVFTWTLAGNLLKPGTSERAAPVWNSADGEARRVRSFCARRWPLAVLLAIQGAVSGALIFANTAFGDEALYLWAGHAERSGTAASKFASYFSGAPQVYPLLSSALPSLTAARLAALVMMLAVTVLAWRTARLTTGSDTGAYAAAVAWALSEPALRMGAFATYDPPAILLVCTAIWLSAEAAHRRHRGELIAVSAACFAVAGLTAYSYLLYLPALAAVTACLHGRGRGWRAGVATAAWQAAGAAALFALAATALKIWPGMLFTTVSRSLADQQPPADVLSDAWAYGGLILIAALAAVPAAPRALRPAAAAMAAGAFLIPAYQALDARTGWSLDKHMAPGIFCGALAIAAGCAALRDRKTLLRAAFLAAAGLALLAAYAPEAAGVQESWPGTASLAAAVRPLALRASGVLVTNLPASVLDYDTMPASLHALTWDSTLANAPAGPQSSWEAAYRARLRSGAPPLVVLAFTGKAEPSQVPALLAAAASGKTAELSAAIGQESGQPGLPALTLALLGDPSYREVAAGPCDAGWSHGFTPGTWIIWKRVPVPAARHAAPHRRRRS